MPDAPTPLDLDAIEAAIAWCRTYNFGMYQADRLAHEHAPALVEEVERLRAEVAMTARPAPAWDEEAVVEAIARALFQRAHPGSTAWDALPVDEFGKEVWRESARGFLAVVHDHLPVKPGREDVVDEFVPTTEDVRLVYGSDSTGMLRGGLVAAFDRWLAAHDRETAARAWDGAVRAMRYEDGTPVELVANVNPYRKGDPT